VKKECHSKTTTASRTHRLGKPTYLASGKASFKKWREVLKTNQLGATTRSSGAGGYEGGAGIDIAPGKSENHLGGTRLPVTVEKVGERPAETGGVQTRGKSGMRSNQRTQKKRNAESKNSKLATRGLRCQASTYFGNRLTRVHWSERLGRRVHSYLKARGDGCEGISEKSCSTLRRWCRTGVYGAGLDSLSKN